jgi:hypothetical protein
MPASRACGAGRSAGWRSAGRAAGARRPRVAGRVGVPVSLMRPRSATACGLRATALRCSAPRASARGRRRSRPVLPAGRTAPARAPRPRFARQPWAPALLAAPEVAKQEPPPAPLGNVPRLAGEKTEKCAREGERVRRSRRAGRAAPRDGSARQWRERELARSPRATLTRFAAHGEAPAPQAREAGTALKHPPAIPGNRR